MCVNSSCQQTICRNHSCMSTYTNKVYKLRWMFSCSLVWCTSACCPIWQMYFVSKSIGPGPILCNIHKIFNSIILKMYALDLIYTISTTRHTFIFERRWKCLGPFYAMSAKPWIFGFALLSMMQCFIRGNDISQYSVTRRSMFHYAGR